jgi:hypothetical protein
MGHPLVYARLLLHKLLVDSASFDPSCRRVRSGSRCLSSLDLAHRSYAASPVIALATFLEAAVSELFQDAPPSSNVAERLDPHQFR